MTLSASTPSPEEVSIKITTDPLPIRELALATWFATYQSILAKEQIDYMLEKIYTLEALQQQMKEGQTFLLLSYSGKPAAFAAFSCLQKNAHLYKLNKLYIHPAYQGQGYGRMLLQEVTQQIKKAGGKKLELNVHRENPAQYFYSKHGFKIKKIIDLPFGPFTLNDYIMVLNINEPEGD